MAAEIINAGDAGRQGGDTLRIETNPQQRLITLWLTGEESTDELRAVIDRFRGTRCKVAVFRSGKCDLTECTTGLLLNNRG